MDENWLLLSVTNSLLKLLYSRWWKPCVDDVTITVHEVEESTPECTSSTDRVFTSECPAQSVHLRVFTPVCPYQSVHPTKVSAPPPPSPGVHLISGLERPPSVQQTTTTEVHGFGCL